MSAVPHRPLLNSEQLQWSQLRTRWPCVRGLSDPLVLGYSVYSLVHQTHKNWYSWVLGSLVGAVYTFGFITMTPQLYINYKLKSVAVPPPRATAPARTHTHTPYKSATGPAARLAHSLATAAERHAEQAVRPHSDSKATQTAKQHTETTHKNSPTQTESYLLATAQYCYVILTLNPGRVQHMPWRVMCYKSLNTFVDDLFAFIIKMPMLHRIACFRDGATCTFAASCGQASTLPIEPCWRRLLIARARWLCAQTSYFSSSCTSGTFTRSI